MEKMVPEGRLHMRPFQFHLKEHWRYPQSLDSLLPWTESISVHLVAESCKCDERRRPSSQRPQYPTLYRRLKRRLGLLLRTKFYKGSVVKSGEKATHKRPRVEGGFTGPPKVYGPVSKPNSSSGNGQLTSGSLHKQTRRNSLSGDLSAPVEDHDMVPSLSHNIKSQTHSRVSECDGRPPIQVEPSAVHGVVTASTGVQTDLSQVVHSSCRPVCHSSEPQTPSIRVPYPRPKGLGHRCSEHKLDSSHCLCLPSNGSPSQGDQKIGQCHCLIIVIAPGWPGMPWFWDLVQLSTEIPLQLPVSTTLLKQSHLHVFHSNLQHLNLHTWCLGVDNSKNKASLWRWQRELLPLNGHQQGPSTSQSGPYLKDGAEKIRWISPLHL